MLYTIANNIKEVNTNTYDDKHLYAGYFNEEEFREKFQEDFHFSREIIQQLHHFKRSKSKISKIDAYPDYYIGEIVLMNKERMAYTQTIFFIIRKNLFLIIANDELRSHYKSKLLEYDIQITSLERLIFLFLDDFIQNDNLMIDSIQQTLSDIDDHVFKNTPLNFNRLMEKPRKQIMMLDHTYDHLLEIGEELVDNELGFFDQDTRYLKILKDRFSRLHNATNLMQEFMVTIRENHQSNIDNDLNKTMKLLTVLTAIFQPLTLIVGWYGMNFTNMPELTWRYGYIFVILLSVISISLCYWIFRKKKLF